MARQLTLAILLSSAFPLMSVPAQTVLRLPGKAIEILGPRHWTAATIRDSLRRRAPNVAIDSPEFPSVLHTALRFPDVKVIEWGPGGRVASDTIERTVIAAVEPQDSACVRHAPASDSARPPRPPRPPRPYPRWAIATELARRYPHVPSIAMNQEMMEWQRTLAYRYDLDEDEEAAADAYRGFLWEHEDPAIFAEARRILSADKNERTRVVAVTLMLNFLQNDSALYAVLDAATEVDGPVGVIAREFLHTATWTAPRRHVDWRPVSPLLHDILDGSSASMFPEILELLSATGADTTLAVPLLRGGGRMLLDFAGSEHYRSQWLGHRLLVQLAGKDLGPDVAAWRRWLNSL